MSNRPLNRLNSIDALRGFAALIVVVYHARAEFWTGFRDSWNQFGLSAPPDVWLGYLTLPFNAGWIGVQIFFVLSGYCIHRRGARMIQADPDAKLQLGIFFIRRFWRIYLVYIAALLLTVAVDTIAQRYGGLPPKSGQDNSWAAFWLSVFSLQGVFRPTYGSNTVFWTLSIEMHLYLAYPLMFWVSRRRGPMAALLLSLAVSVLYILANRALGFGAWFGSQHGGGPLFFPFWFTWMVGFHLAEIEVGRAKAWRWLRWTWPAVLAGGVLLKMRGAGLLAEPVIAVGLMGLVAWALSPSGAKRFAGLGGRGLAWVGLFSYSLYAIHRPVFVGIKAVIGDERYATIFLAAGGVAVSVVAAWLFYHAVERWSLRVPPVFGRG